MEHLTRKEFKRLYRLARFYNVSLDSNLYKLMPEVMSVDDFCIVLSIYCDCLKRRTTDGLEHRLYVFKKNKLKSQMGAVA